MKCNREAPRRPPAEVEGVTLSARLGNGAFGTVYECAWTADQGPYKHICAKVIDVDRLQLRYGVRRGSELVDRELARAAGWFLLLNILLHSLSDSMSQACRLG